MSSLPAVPRSNLLHLHRLAPLSALLLAALALAFVPASSRADDDEDEAPRLIVVQGRGSVSAMPDEALLRLGVSERGMQLEALRAAVNERAARVLAHLRAQGIADPQISASGISLRPEYRWDQQRREQELIGYHVERRISAKLSDLEQLAAVIEGAADAGANEISPPQLGHSESAALRREALARASRDAQAAAQAIAESLGLSLGGAHSVTVLDAGMPRPMAESRMMRAAVADSAAGGAEYLSGEMEFEAAVQASFSIVAGNDQSAARRSHAH